MFITCKNYSSAATLGNSWQIIHFPRVDHFKKCASFSGHQSLWQLVFVWENELNHQYTNSNFISPPLLMHRRKINAHASLWPALRCFFLNQWHPTCCQRRIMPALCGNGETVINFKVPQWLEFFQALRACISGISANTGYLGNRRLRQKKNEIYRFLIRFFFLFFKTQLEGEEAAEADKDAWNVTGPSHKGSYDGFVKGFCMHFLHSLCSLRDQKLTASRAWTSSSSGKNLMLEMWIRRFSVSLFFPLPIFLKENQISFFLRRSKTAVLKDTHFALCPLAKNTVILIYGNGS